jgi:hypothetical protein
LRDAAIAHARRYYTNQKAFDTFAAGALKDDFKRKGREFKEREEEAQLLDQLYQVFVRPKA